MPDDTIQFGEPDVEQDGMSFKFEWNRGDQALMRIVVADVRNDGDAIYGEFTVWWLLDQPIGVRPIQPATVLKMNSSHSTGWRSIPRELSKRFSNVDFEGAVTIVVDECMRRFKTGDPTVSLFEGTRSTEPPFILEPWIASSGITVIYGEGGLSKSLLTLAMAISISTGVPIFGKEPRETGPVIIFDYEDDHQTHVDRLLAICRSFGIPPDEAQVYHHALATKVSTSYREMKRRADDVGAKLCILDSVGMGRGGSSTASEDTIRMFRYLRQTGYPFLAIDHVSKESKGKAAGDRDAFGSVYTMNSVRLGWSLVQQHTKDEGILMYAANTKHNHVPKQAAQTVKVVYRNDEKGIPEFIDIEAGNDFGMMMPGVDPLQRLYMVMSNGSWWTYQMLADSLGSEETYIRNLVSRDATLDEPSIQKKKEGRTVWVRSERSVSEIEDTHEDTHGDDDETR